jgi:hypothetical protein
MKVFLLAGLGMVAVVAVAWCTDRCPECGAWLCPVNLFGYEEGEHRGECFK